MKKIVSLCLVLCMICSLYVPVEVSAANFNLEQFKAMALANWTSPIKKEIYPVNSGREFGASRSGGRNHGGIDWIPISGCVGTPVYAMDSGTLIQYCASFYAGTSAIAIQNDSGGILVYGEIAPAYTAIGTRVSKGQQIGTIKLNDYNSAMLHLELYAGTHTGSVFGYSAYKNIDHPYLAVNKNCWNRADILDPTFLLNCGKGNIPEPTPEIHQHTYTYNNDTEHPHREYKYCSCGSKEYTGFHKLVNNCENCYPLGSIKLTRSFDKTKGTATFYRNDVKNATSYTLKLYKDGGLNKTYNMSSTTYNVSGLTSGNYSAELYVKNSNTNQEKKTSCSTFKIVDTYQITYDANGGSNAPSSRCINAL